MALAAANKGQSKEAVRFLQAAIAERSNDFELHNNLGNIYKSLGDYDAAKRSYGQAIALNNACFAALYNLGNVLAAKEEWQEAVAAYSRALELQPNFTDLNFNLALSLRQAGDFEAAIASLQRTLLLEPGHMEAYISLGNTLSDAGRLDEAINAYQLAIELKSDSPILFNNLGVALTAQGKYLAARDALKQALTLDSFFTQAKNNLAVVARQLGELGTAIQLLQEATVEDPRYAEAYRNLGQCFAAAGDYQKAIRTYEKALAVNPGYYEAIIELGICHAGAGNKTEAISAFDRAKVMNPASIIPLWGSCMASIPNFYDSEIEIEQSREDFSNKLLELEQRLRLDHQQSIVDAEYAVGTLQPFFLSYQNRDNRELRARYGKLICKIMQARYPQWSQVLDKIAAKDNEPIRLGIVSRHFSNHSDWRILIGGIFDGLDREQFQVHAYWTGGIKDDATETARKQAHVFVEGLGMEELCARIKQDNLHALLFTEIGMDPLALKIAALRLAPIQGVFWMCPETPGLPTIDYFLSSELMEPADGGRHYNEKLVRLPNLCSYYIPTKVEPDTTPIFKELRADSVRYLCVQSIFKYLPEYDSILIEIARRVPAAQFIFITKPPELARKLAARLRRRFKEHGLDSDAHILFLTTHSHAQFLGLLSKGHVYLDSTGYSGNLTTRDALEQDIPVVTMRGEMMRGRQSMAMLDLMELPELVADNARQYVDIACRLGLDENLRNSFSKRIAEKRYLLYRDSETIAGLQKFIKDLVYS